MIVRQYPRAIESATDKLDNWNDSVKIGNNYYGVREFRKGRHMKDNCFGCRETIAKDEACECRHCRMGDQCGRLGIQYFVIRCNKCKCAWKTEVKCASCDAIVYFSDERPNLCDQCKKRH